MQQLKVALVTCKVAILKQQKISSTSLNIHLAILQVWSKTHTLRMVERLALLLRHPKASLGA